MRMFRMSDEATTEVFMKEWEIGEKEMLKQIEGKYLSKYMYLYFEQRLNEVGMKRNWWPICSFAIQGHLFTILINCEKKR